MGFIFDFAGIAAVDNSRRDMMSSGMTPCSLIVSYYCLMIDAAEYPKTFVPMVEVIS
jgi:hypothetical protein